MTYGLIGEKLRHSYSKEIHAYFGDYDYQLCELAPQALPDFLSKRDFSAINVTIPYKEAVIPYLDRIDAAAAAIGAVNTVCRVGARLYGYNTDFAGLSDLIDRVGVPLLGATVLLLGSGGTAKTAAAVCRAHGAKEVVTVGRTARPSVISYEQAYTDYTHATYIINATPVGMYPAENAMPIRLDHFPMLRGLCDAIYNPLRTDLVQAAKERGLPAEGGLYMLVAQAAHAAALFTGQPVEQGQIARAYAAVRQQKENIYLIGMPGSGKSTVGRALGKRLGRPFIDTDEEIVRSAGMPIPAIFAQEGEAGFRRREAEALAAVAHTARGAVIATGGGAILRQENVRHMRRGGRIYFLDRRLENIRPTKDRPLSQDRQALQQRYEERYPLYIAACDTHICVDEQLGHTIETIRKDFLSL